MLDLGGGDAEACGKQERAEDDRERNNDRRIRNNLQRQLIRLSVGEKRESDGLAPSTTASARSAPKILKNAEKSGRRVGHEKPNGVSSFAILLHCSVH